MKRSALICSAISGLCLGFLIVFLFYTPQPKPETERETTIYITNSSGQALVIQFKESWLSTQYMVLSTNDFLILTNRFYDARP